jgi:hypothetical protein
MIKASRQLQIPISKAKVAAAAASFCRLQKVFEHL